MQADRSESVTMRDIVSAPIIVDAATNARRFATSGRVLPDSAAMISTSSRKACVAAARVFSSHRAISLPSAASGQPPEGSSLSAGGGYAAPRPFTPFLGDLFEKNVAIADSVAAAQASATS